MGSNRNDLHGAVRRALCAAATVCAALSVAAGLFAEPALPNQTKIMRNPDGSFLLLRDQKPYFIKGGATGPDGGMNRPDSQFRTLKASGANSVRTWGAENDPQVYDQAEKQGFTVCAGLWIGKGLDFANPATVQALRDRFVKHVTAYKDHPAILMWGVGNEYEGAGTDPKMWKAINTICGAIKVADPAHPTLTVLAGLSEQKMSCIKAYCPNLDVIGVNMYASFPSLPTILSSCKPDRPYVVTEYGPPGPWDEVPAASWGAQIEPSSTEKAEFCLKGYQNSVESKASVVKDFCLGSYMYFWGIEPMFFTTHTWYGSFLLGNNERLGMVDAATFAWTGNWPANRCPLISSLKSDAAKAEVALAGQYMATVEVQDPEGKPLSISWEIREEMIGAVGSATNVVPECILKASGFQAVFQAPSRAGPFRLFVYAKDGEGGAATANFPFFAKEGLPKPSPLISKDGDQVAAEIKASTPPADDHIPRTFLHYPPDTRLEMKAVPKVPMPAYLAPFVDPVFNNHVIRITDEQGLRHHYSKDQPWNCDGSLIIMNKTLLDGRTYKSKGAFTRTREILWSHKEPNMAYGVDDKQFVRVDVDSGAFTPIFSLKQYDEILIGPFEGNISTDDRFVALACRTGEKGLSVVILDIQNRTAVASREFPNQWPNLDWVSVSQSGRYVIFNWGNNGIGELKGIEEYDRDLKFLRQLSPDGAHGDCGFDPDGNEVYVQLNFVREVWPCTVISFRLDSGKPVVILDKTPGAFGGHLSCRNYRRPGWAYVCARNLNQIFAVKLDGSQTVEVFCHAHSNPLLAYAAETHAVPNPAGDKVMFVSDWDTNDLSKVRSYVVESDPTRILPPSAKEALAPAKKPEESKPERAAQEVQAMAVTAAADAYRTGRNVTLSVPAPGVLANDRSDSGGPLSAFLVNNYSKGMGELALQPDGSFTFTPASSGLSSGEWVGFTYQARNAKGEASAETTVVIDIE